MFLFQAVALPVAKFCVLAWTRVYTMVAPKSERECRRAEILSDLHEQISSSRSEGVGPAGIAVCILLRMLWGVKDDVAWFTPFLPSLIATKLEAGGAKLSRARIPSLVVIIFATLIFHNGRLLISHGIQSQGDWILANISFVITVALISLVYLSPLRRRVESVMRPVLMVPIIFLIAVDVFDLNRIMDLDKTLLSMVPAMLALGLNEKVFRVHVFRNRLWPLPASWGIILTISLGIAWSTGDLYAMLIAWGSMGLVALVYGITITLTVNLVSGILYGSTSVTASGMRLVATRIRRLQ